MTWLSVPDLIREEMDQEVESWRPELDAIEALMHREGHSGGGMTGSTPELERVRSALIASGRRSLAWEEAVRRASRRR